MGIATVKSSEKSNKCLNKFVKALALIKTNKALADISAKPLRIVGKIAVSPLKRLIGRGGLVAGYLSSLSSVLRNLVC